HHHDGIPRDEADERQREEIEFTLLTEIGEPVTGDERGDPACDGPVPASLRHAEVFQRLDQVPAPTHGLRLEPRRAFLQKGQRALIHGIALDVLALQSGAGMRGGGAATLRAHERGVSIALLK
ncbi:MAG: hypothetical protein ACK56I_25950, partial [bacterium]